MLKNAQKNKFSKVVEYKIRTQKSVVFLYSNNEQFKKEVKKNLIYNSIIKNKIFKDKLNKGSERLTH